MPADLKEQLEQAADDGNRSLTAEIVDRLKRSFDSHSMSPLMSAALAQALADVAEYAHKHGVTPDEALPGLVSAALSRDTEPVYFFVIDKEMKMAQLREMFSVASKHIPEDATIHVQPRGMPLNPAVDADDAPGKPTVKRMPPRTRKTAE